MRKKLLITTALVAFVSVSHAYAEPLPENAENLISGTYEVDATNQTINHDGVVNLSGDAILSVTGEMTRDEDGILQGKSLFNVSDKMTLSGESKFNLTETISNLNLTVSENATATIKDTALVGTMKVDGGTVNLDGTAAVFDDFSVSGGVVNSYNDTPLNTANATISGGIINLNGHSLNALTGEVNMTDGVINMNNGSTDPDLTLWAANAINIKGGTINMNGDNASIDTFYDWLENEENGFQMSKPETPGNINISNATINVNSNSAEISSEGEINVSDNAVINIASGAKLSSYESFSIDNSDLVLGDKATINLTGTGAINIAGNLAANVEGDGNLNIKSSNAVIDGDIKGSQLTFEADHSLSKAISGTIGELASLSVNEGTLIFDKQTGLINDVNVDENSGLHVKIPGKGPEQENIQLAVNSFTSSGNIVLDSNSDITARNNLEIHGGSVVATNGDLESFNTININGGTLNFSKESDISGLASVNINDGSVNISDVGEIWSLGDVNLKGGTINMSNLAMITTEYNALDSAFGEQSKPSVAGNINVTGSTVNIKDQAIFITEGEINVKEQGVVNIEEGATLFAVKEIPDGTNQTNLPEVIASTDKTEILLNDNGIINVAGTLAASLSGNGNLNITSSNAVINGDIKGSQLTFEADHSLSKALLGENIELASLNVNKGTLTFDKQPTSITNLNVAGGLDIGTNTVKASNVSFKDNSTLKFTVAGKEDGSYGKIKANTIDVSTTGTKLDLTLNSSVLGKDESKDFTILDGKVTGDFAELSKNSRYEFEKLGNGQYKITGKASAADIAVEAGGNANNAGTASAWDSVSLANPSGSTAGQVANILAELSNSTDAGSQKTYVDALTALAPETAPMVQQAQTQTSNQVFGAVGTRLSGGSISTGGEGMSSGDNIFERAAMWVQGLFNKSKLDDTSKSYGFDADSNGIAMGAEKYVTEDTKVGLGYAYTNTDIDGFKRETDVDTHTAFVYGEYKPSNWYVNGIASYGWSDYDESKNVAGINVKSDYDAETFGLQAMTGYDMQMKHFGLTPEVGLRYVHISQDSYKDSADQRVSANDSDILTGVIGAKVSKTWTLENGMNIKPEARIAATYDLMNDDTNSVVTLANGSAYSVEGEALDRFGMEFGAGLTAEINDNVELSLGYEGKFREDYQDHTGLLNAKYKF